MESEDADIITSTNVDEAASDEENILMELDDQIIEDESGLLSPSDLIQSDVEEEEPLTTKSLTITEQIIEYEKGKQSAVEPIPNKNITSTPISNLTKTAPQSSTETTQVVKKPTGQIVFIQNAGGSGTGQAIRIAGTATIGKKNVAGGAGVQFIKTSDGNIVQLKNKAVPTPILPKPAATGSTVSSTTAQSKFLLNGSNGQRIIFTSPAAVSRSSSNVAISSITTSGGVTKRTFTVAQAQKMGLLSSAKLNEFVTAARAQKQLLSVKTSAAPQSAGTPPQNLTNVLPIRPSNKLKISPVPQGTVSSKSTSVTSVPRILNQTSDGGLAKMASTGQIKAVYVPGKGVQYVRVVNKNSPATTTTAIAKIISSNSMGGVGARIVVQNKPIKHQTLTILSSSGAATTATTTQSTTTTAAIANTTTTVTTITSAAPKVLNNVSKVTKVVNSNPDKIQQQNKSLLTATTVTANKNAANSLLVATKNVSISAEASTSAVLPTKQTTNTPTVSTKKIGLSPPPPATSQKLIDPINNTDSLLKLQIVQQKKSKITATIITKQEEEEIEDEPTMISTNNDNILSTSSVTPQLSTTIDEGLRRKHCNCTKSQCLKLYCDCFANGEFCSNCNCKECFNNLDYEGERQKAIKMCLERNPHAFKPKIGKPRDQSDMNRRHTKGCNCKRSGCLKNYCECYEAKIACSDNCKCIGCRNVDESFDGRNNSSDSSFILGDKTVGEKRNYEDKVGSVEQQPTSPSAAKKPCNFMTQDVIEATIQCVIAQAEECQKNNLSTKTSEKMILEEFGRCLVEIIDFSIKNTDN